MLPRAPWPRTLLVGTVPALPDTRGSGSPQWHSPQSSPGFQHLRSPGAHRAVGFEACLTASGHLPTRFRSEVSCPGAEQNHAQILQSSMERILVCLVSVMSGTNSPCCDPRCDILKFLPPRRQQRQGSASIIGRPPVAESFRV